MILYTSHFLVIKLLSYVNTIDIKYKILKFNYLIYAIMITMMLQIL